MSEPSGIRFFAQEVFRAAPAPILTYITLSAAGGLSPFAQVVALRILLERALRGGPHPAGSFLLPLALLTGSYLVSEGVLLGVASLSTFLNSRLTTRLGQRVLQSGQDLSLVELDQGAVHDQMRRALDESRYRPIQLISQVSSLIQATVSVVSIFALLLRISWLVAIMILLSPIPVLVGQLLAGRLSYRVENETAKYRRMLDYFIQLASDKAAVRDMRVLGAADFFVTTFFSTARTLWRWQGRLLRQNVLLYLPLMLVSLSLTLGAQIVALTSALHGGRPANAVTVVQSIIMLTVAFEALTGAVAGVTIGLRFGRDYSAFALRPPSAAQWGTLPFPARLVAGIQLDGVTFSYPNAAGDNLRVDSLRLPPTGLVIVSGPNGAGKSTLCKILLGLYPPGSGQLLVDGLPLEEYSESSVRAWMSAAFQDFSMFHLSLRHNLCMGSAEAVRMTDPQLLDCLADVGLAEFVRGLPDGLDSALGGRFGDGIDLSMGQWQRLALARVIIRRPAVIVLDEPWAFQDAAADTLLRRTVERLARSSLVIIVTHRPLVTSLRPVHIEVLDGQATRIMRDQEIIA
ncbi:MAG TPA: ABC transporter ATP-binding protein [Streptosporangiaceae bacterium]|jgi:ATP-binding cassette subfamily B protein